MERPSAFEIVKTREKLMELSGKIWELRKGKDDTQYVEIKREASEFQKIRTTIIEAISLLEDWLKER